jgi:hypothetical protein
VIKKLSAPVGLVVSQAWVKKNGTVYKTEAVGMKFKKSREYARKLNLI